MKERNHKENCVPHSSNCITWDRDDMCCINVCKGDSLSEVGYKMALEICNLKDLLNLSDLDISCLLNNCTECSDPVKDVYTVLRLLIQKACIHDTLIENLSDTSSTSTTTISSQALQVAQGLVYTDSNGFPVTSLDVPQYVSLIGSNLSQTMSDVNTLQTDVATISDRVDQLETDLGSSPYIEEITVPDIMGDNNPHTIAETVIELSNQFVEVVDSLGTPEGLSASVAMQPVNLASEPALNQSGTMTGYANWVDSPQTVADTLTNMWITILDIRGAVESIQTLTAQSCSDIQLNFTVILSDNGATARLYFGSYCIIPTGFEDCESGSFITITDTEGNTHNAVVNVTTQAATNSPLELNLSGTGLNTTSDYTFQLNACLTNDTLTCEKVVIKQVKNDASLCPQLTTIPASTSISYVLQIPTTTVDYRVVLLSAETSPVTVITTNNHNNPSSLYISDMFTGLTPGTTYRIGTYVVVDGEEIESCQLVEVTTTA